ncbi:MAG: hypothetical protein R2828_11245 [Saprospiraceae bacterium]
MNSHLIKYVIISALLLTFISCTQNEGKEIDELKYSFTPPKEEANTPRPKPIQVRQKTILPAGIITLDPDHEVNQRHPYIETLMKKDLSFLSTVYRINKENTPVQHGPTDIITQAGGKNSLVFTINDQGTIRYDTLQNRVHFGQPKASFRTKVYEYFHKMRTLFVGKRDLEAYTVTGRLPRGVYHSVNYKPATNRLFLTFGLLNKPSKVTIEIVDTKDQVIASINDKELAIGEHRWEWQAKEKRAYLLKIEMDGEVLRQWMR